MQKVEVVNALRAILEAANLADATEPVRNDLPAGAAFERGGLYGHIKQALISLGEGEAQEQWTITGEWPSDELSCINCDGRPCWGCPVDQIGS